MVKFWVSALKAAKEHRSSWMRISATFLVFLFMGRNTSTETPKAASSSQLQAPRRDRSLPGLWNRYDEVAEKSFIRTAGMGRGQSPTPSERLSARLKLVP